MLLFVLLLASVQETPPVAVQATPSAAQEKKVCRRSVANTGSIMGSKKTCRTKAEWATIDRDARLNADRLADQGIGRRNIGLGTPGESRRP